MPASDFDLQLEELFNRSVGRLIAAEVFDKQAFEDLRDYLCEKAEVIKTEHVVSKQVITYLLQAASAIESRSESVEGTRQNAHLVVDFRNLLGLISAGEGCKDRKPGVPHIV